MKSLSDEKIVACWQRNVAPWVSAVRGGAIESRQLVTNKAIINAVLSGAPQSVLDIGCGEGWLARALVNAGVDVLGVDAVPALIAAAQQGGAGRFKVLPYDVLSHHVLDEQFDVAVCNFSLLGNESVTRVFEQVPLLLNGGGRLIVQTIHPLAGCGDSDYQDGWREGSWAGFSDEFSDPAPWYFRTMETWRALFARHGFILGEIIEPVNPVSGKIASVIFIGELEC